MLTVFICMSIGAYLFYKLDGYFSSVGIILGVFYGVVASIIVLLVLNIILFTNTESIVYVDSVPIVSVKEIVPSEKDYLTKTISCQVVKPSLFVFAGMVCKEKYTLHTTKLKTITKDSNIELAIKE